MGVPCSCGVRWLLGSDLSGGLFDRVLKSQTGEFRRELDTTPGASV